MYLTKKTDVNEDERHDLVITGIEHIDPHRVESISEDAGTWRKANAIHRWFVEHVQGGEDDGRPYPVSREQLAALLAAVTTVLDDPRLGPTVLPTQGGFFFGSTAYDAGYVEDLQRTQALLRDAFREENQGKAFFYEASW